MERDWERFNNLKVVPGCSVHAVYSATELKQGGRFVTATLIKFTRPGMAQIKVTKSQWTDCPEGKVFEIKRGLLILAIKNGSFPTGVTEQQYQQHEQLMAQYESKQLQLF